MLPFAVGQLVDKPKLHHTIFIRCQTFLFVKHNTFTHIISHTSLSSSANFSHLHLLFIVTLLTRVKWEKKLICTLDYQFVSEQSLCIACIRCRSLRVQWADEIRQMKIIGISIGEFSIALRWIDAITVITTICSASDSDT